MKHILLLTSMLFFCVIVQAESKPSAADTLPPLQVVEAACGQCQLGLKGNDCDLAVRIKGKAYFVEGTNIDDHGDAHAKDGFCNAIRKAEVRGRMEGDKFRVFYFRLLQEPAKKS